MLSFTLPLNSSLKKERMFLWNTPAESGQKRTPSTINRYTASLSALFSYAVRQLRWIDESPCAHLLKLKENPGRDRVLSVVEIERLLTACRQSRSHIFIVLSLFL